MGGTKVREVMTDRPRCITPDTPVSEAARLMKSEDVGSLPILEGERVTGIVTDRDIVLHAVAEGKDPRGMPVREVASRDLVTVGQDADLSEALQLYGEPSGPAAPCCRRRRQARWDPGAG